MRMLINMIENTLHTLAHKCVHLKLNSKSLLLPLITNHLVIKQHLTFHYVIFIFTLKIISIQLVFLVPTSKGSKI